MPIAEPAARGFEAAADLYEARRPSYPDVAITWLASELEIEESSQLLDVGAGTGKLTRQLVRRTPRVIALEPVRAMWAQFRSALDVPIAQAVAEALPVRTGSVDAVLVGQAFHWFDFEPALAEIHRVLRPGGARQPRRHRIGEIFNIRSSSPAGLPRPSRFDVVT